MLPPDEIATEAQRIHDELFQAIAFFREHSTKAQILQCENAVNLPFTALMLFLLYRVEHLNLSVQVLISDQQTSPENKRKFDA